MEKILFKYSDRLSAVKNVYRLILKQSKSFDTITKGHVKIKARFIVEKHKHNHEL